MTTRSSKVWIALIAVGLTYVGSVFVWKWHQLDTRRFEIASQLQVIDQRLMVARQDNASVSHLVTGVEKDGRAHPSTSLDALVRTLSKSLTDAFPGSRFDMLHEGRLLSVSSEAAVLSITVKMQLVDKGLAAQLRRLEAIKPGLLISSLRATPSRTPSSGGEGLVQLEIEGLVVQSRRGGSP